MPLTLGAPALHTKFELPPVALAVNVVAPPAQITAAGAVTVIAGHATDTR